MLHTDQKRQPYPPHCFFLPYGIIADQQLIIKCFINGFADPLAKSMMAGIVLCGVPLKKYALLFNKLILY
jgi:hypothetical protein